MSMNKQMVELREAYKFLSNNSYSSSERAFVKTYELYKEAVEAIRDAKDSLEYCPYCDSWECGHAPGITPKLDAVLAKAEGGGDGR